MSLAIHHFHHALIYTISSDLPNRCFYQIFAFKQSQFLGSLSPLPSWGILETTETVFSPLCHTDSFTLHYLPTVCCYKDVKLWSPSLSLALPEFPSTSSAVIISYFVISLSSWVYSIICVFSHSYSGFSLKPSWSPLSSHGEGSNEFRLKSWLCYQHTRWLWTRFWAWHPHL